MKDLKPIIKLVVPLGLIIVFSTLIFFEIGPPELLAIFITISTLASECEYITKTVNELKKRRKSRKRVKNFNKILLGFQGFFVEDFLELPEQASAKENLIEYTREVLPLDSVFFDLFLLYLKEKDISGFKLKEKELLAREVEEVIREFNWRNPDEEDVKIGWGFYNIFCRDNKNIRLNKTNRSGFFEDECFKDKFLSKYVSKERLISKLTSKKERLRDYNKTLTKLHQMGKLNKFGIHKMVSDIGEEKIRKIVMDKIHYFVFWNLFYDSFEEKVYKSLKKRSRKVYRGGIRLREGQGEKEGIMKLFLVVLEEDIPIQEFYKKYLEGIYKSTGEVGWLSVHKAKFEGEHIYKERFDPKPSDNTKKAISAKNAFVSGQQIVELDIKQRLINSYLTPEQLLTVLPLNLFLPDLSSEKKQELIRNNEEIKEEFGISKLTDWANTTTKTKEIAKYLKENYFNSDEVSFWVKKVKRIKKKASEVQEALHY